MTAVAMVRQTETPGSRIIRGLLLLAGILVPADGTRDRRPRDLPQGPNSVTASAGLLSTASGLVFFGENSGSFMAADAASGKVLWEFPTNHVWKASPMTYMFDNTQYIAIAVGQSIVAFGLPDGGGGTTSTADNAGR